MMKFLKEAKRVKQVLSANTETFCQVFTISLVPTLTNMINWRLSE